MAEVNVEKTRPEERERTESQAVERRRQAGMGRAGETFPSLFWRNPADVFNMNPFALMRQLNEQIDRAFSEQGNYTWSPAVEISERDGKLMIHADLPGLKQDDVKVEVLDDQLIIQGERKREHEENAGGVRRSERSYGSFYRAIALPQGANVDQIQARFNNGVLEVSVPAPEEQHKRRQIPIGQTNAQPAASGQQTAGQTNAQPAASGQQTAGQTAQTQKAGQNRAA